MNLQESILTIRALSMHANNILKFEREKEWHDQEFQKRTDVAAKDFHDYSIKRLNTSIEVSKKRYMEELKRLNNFSMPHPENMVQVAEQMSEPLQP